ncbi:MAG: hypothetical protein EXQ87_03955 [Alphaproteobacteria bacterium]|nr:hypothetical protein [Alphaproteobacteria bacterium]
MRAALTVLVPLLLPIAVYVLVLVVRRGRPSPSWWHMAPWLAGTGLLLLATTLGLWSTLGHDEPGARYEPARLEGGRVLPGQAGDAPRR